MTEIEQLAELLRASSPGLDPDSARDRIFSLLTAPDRTQELTRRLDDLDPANWVSLDQVKALRESRDE